MRGWACLALAAAIAARAQSPADAFDKAVAALSSGDYAAAESGFLEILKRSPNHVDTLHNLGVVYSRTGRVDQAIGVYQRALDLSPHNPGILLNLGLAYMRQRSYAEALPVFQELVEADARSLPARDIHLLFPFCEGYLKQAPTAEARRKLEHFLAAAPPAAASLVRCKLAYVGERLEEAAQQCRRALEIDPTFAGAHLELARVLVAQHSPDAGPELTAAIRENPGDPESLYDLGVALLREGRAADAANYLERARRLDPNFWGSYFHLGKIKLQAHQPAQAVPLLQRAVDLNPTDFSLFYELARALAATGRSEEAARALERVRELMAEELDKDTKALRK
jgi:tetratricopeptide (TPR) repeat protein